MTELVTADLARRKRSVLIAGHRTSISLEAAFWEALRAVARHRGSSVNRLIAAIDAERLPGPAGNLSSALRVFVLDCYRRGELPAPDAVRAPGPSGAATETPRAH